MARKNHIMNEIFESNKQDYDEIRKLCLICHGLERTGENLFENSSHDDKSDATKKAFKNIMSGSLKKLAIAIQRTIYHKELNKNDCPALSGDSIYYENFNRVYKELNIKDVCDKILNADSVSKESMPAGIFGDGRMATLFAGEDSGEKWALYFSVECFVESILDFLDALEGDGSHGNHPPVNLFAREYSFNENFDAFS